MRGRLILLMGLLLLSVPSSPPTLAGTLALLGTLLAGSLLVRVAQPRLGFWREPRRVAFGLSAVRNACLLLVALGSIGLLSSSGQQVPGASAAVAPRVAAGYVHSLALTSDGTVWAWGLGRYGALGNGGTANSATPVRVSGVTGAIAIAGGDQFSLALTSDGTVWAWGSNGSGQLGSGTADNSSHPTPTRVLGLTGVTAIAAEGYSALALKADGTVWAWGDNYFGSLGNGTADGNAHPTPTLVLGLSGVTAIAGGLHHSLAVKSDGTAWAWRRNTDGQLGATSGDSCGASNFACSRTPIQVDGLSGVTAIAGGWYHSLAAKSDGTAWGWGWNGDGELGTGAYGTFPCYCSRTPVQVSGLAGVVTVAGGDYHSLATKGDGTAWGWGYNRDGELGTGSAISAG